MIDIQLRGRVAEALAEHDGDEAAHAFRAGAAAEYWLGQADVALAIVAPLLAEKDQELEKLHQAWTQQHEKITALRTHLEPGGDTPAEWVAGAPEPEIYVRAVRGHRTSHIYFRESREGFGGRWVCRSNGDWFVWTGLLGFETCVNVFNLGV